VTTESERQMSLAIDTTGIAVNRDVPNQVFWIVVAYWSVGGWWKVFPEWYGSEDRATGVAEELPRGYTAIRVVRIDTANFIGGDAQG